LQLVIMIPSSGWGGDLNTLSRGAAVISVPFDDIQHIIM